MRYKLWGLVGLLLLGACNTDNNFDEIQNYSGSGSSNSGSSSSSVEQVDNTEDYSETASEAEADNADSHELDSDYTWDEDKVQTITFNNSSITANDSSGVDIDGTEVTITAAGIYSLSGTLTDGQLIVNTDDEDNVVLIFNGINLTNTSNAPVYIQSSSKTIIELAANTNNYLTDAEEYTYEDDEDEPNACLYSKDDLSIFGDGTLTVNANYNDGITSKDGLVIASGDISVTSADDGIRGKDYLIIHDGTFTVNSDGDAFKSDNDSNTAKGYIQIDGGTYTINSGDEGLTAETDILITGGNFDITTGGGSDEDESAKGIKAGSIIVIDGDELTINSSDDAIHSDRSISVNSGTLTLASGDDAMHADTALRITGGTIAISTCYEGIESANITINDGNISVNADDDGINVASGNDSSGMNGWESDDSDDYYLNINGGTIYVAAAGDGLDANGTIFMTGGTVLVDGPTDSSNGAIDYDGSFEISGGLLIAAGSSNMAQAPSSSSDQNAVLVKFSSSLSANQLIHLENSDGTSIFSYAPSKTYQSVVFSSPDLTTGDTYTLYTGGTDSGIETNGLYTGGSYTAGSSYTSFTISQTITTISNSSGNR